MNLAYKKILGKFTKVLGFGKTPPPMLGKIPERYRFFLRAYLMQAQKCKYKYKKTKTKMHSNPLSGMCPTPTPALCITLMQAQRRALDACHAYPSGEWSIWPTTLIGKRSELWNACRIGFNEYLKQWMTKRSIHTSQKHPNVINSCPQIHDHVQNSTKGCLHAKTEWHPL